MNPEGPEIVHVVVSYSDGAKWAFRSREAALRYVETMTKPTSDGECYYPEDDLYIAGVSLV